MKIIKKWKDMKKEVYPLLRGDCQEVEFADAGEDGDDEHSEDLAEFLPDPVPQDQRRETPSTRAREERCRTG